MIDAYNNVIFDSSFRVTWNKEIFMKRRIISEGQATSCYFRTSVDHPNRKALVQITEWCNLHCAHCFVSAGRHGHVMPLAEIKNVLIPRLLECRVISVTVTGGEPFAHQDIIQIVTLLREHGLEVSICTNATLISDEQMNTLANLGGVLCNVSLDGFTPESHGKFRGDRGSFETTVSTVRMLARHNLLKGLLVTPSNLAEVSEYAELCKFAVQNGATYVLMNPLSRMGRGTASTERLAAPDEMMRQIKAVTDPFSDQIQLTHIRFPNDKQEPLASCEAGNIVYIFTRGELTVCPYLVFAARTPEVYIGQMSSLSVTSSRMMTSLTGSILIGSASATNSVATQRAIVARSITSVAKDALQQSFRKERGSKKSTPKSAP